MHYHRMKRCLTAIRFLDGLCFYAPVALLVRTQMGITVSQFFTLQLILSLSILLFEVPAGFLSDRIGYRKTMAISQGLMVLARLLLLTAGNYPMFALEALVEGLVISLSSGTESAYLYSFCQGEDYALLSSRLGRAGTVGFLVSTVSYSVILSLTSISGLVAATCIPTALSFLLTLTLPKEPEQPKEETQKVKIHLPRGSVPFFLLLSAISMSYLVFNFFSAVKVERMGLPYESLTWIILAYSAMELLAPGILRRIRIGAYSRAVTALLALSGLLFLGIFLLDSIWCTVLLVVLPLALNLVSTLADELLNEHVDHHGLGSHRAAVLSVFNMGNSLLEIGFLALSAVIAENEGNAAFAFISLFLCAAAIMYLLHGKSSLQTSQ